jgi:hypothetical protein
MPQARIRQYQQTLFEDPPVVPAVRLPPKTQEELRHALTQWIQALAKTMEKGAGDE